MKRETGASPVRTRHCEQGISEKKKDNYYGYTRNHKLINFTGDNIKAGDIVNVEVTDAKTWSLDGKLSK